MRFLKNALATVKSNKDYQLLVGVSVAMLCIPLIIFMVIVVRSRPASEETLEITPTPTSFIEVEEDNEEEVDEDEELDPTVKPTVKPTATVSLKTTPTQTPHPTSAPAAATATPNPTATATRVPSPPQISITYPSEGQSIEMNASQTFCMVDTPTGGNSEGLKRKHSVNDASWTEYTDHFTLCFSPVEGVNRIQVQYKNKFGDESQQYTRQFTFHRTE